MRTIPDDFIPVSDSQGVAVAWFASEKDARLFQAAPQMVGMLRSIIDTVEKTERIGAIPIINKEARDNVTRFLDKATGGSQ